MALQLDVLPDDVLAFLAERHLATLCTVRPDGTPHVVPVGFSYDADARVVRIITRAGSAKARLLAQHPHLPAAVSQVDGARWLTLEGTAIVTAEPDRVAAAVAGYAARYKPPTDREDRVTIEIAVTGVLGRA